MTFNTALARAEAANLPGIWRERWEAALEEIERQAARIAELEDLLITERDGIFQRQKARIAELEGEYEAVTKCFNCGKRAWEIDANEDADLGAIRFDRGSPGNRDEPPEPAQAYFVCNDCLKAEGKIGSSDHIVGADKMIGLTKEQRKAVQEAIFILNGYDLPYYVAQRKVLESLLASPPAWEARPERIEAIDLATRALGRHLAAVMIPACKESVTVLKAMLDEIKGDANGRSV